MAAFCRGAASCLGKGTTATLPGTATDSSGGVVTDVTVRATNLSTNGFREARTDSAGNYSIPFLTAGDYKISATKGGFQAQQNERVTLQVDQNARIDFTMVVGSVTETVNVTASS